MRISTNLIRGMWILLMVIGLTAANQSAALAAPGFDEFPARLPADSVTLQDFSKTLAPAPSGKPAGIYVAGILAFPIVQQPTAQPGFVSSNPGEVTQFGMAEKFGSTGLLAHNTLAGTEFSHLVPGQFAVLIFSDENGTRVEYYRIHTILKYQALDPNNPYSQFRGEDGTLISAADLFYQVYGSDENDLVLQTCIEAGGNPSWGRLFVVASAVTPQVQSALHQANSIVSFTSLGMAGAY